MNWPGKGKRKMWRNLFLAPALATLTVAGALVFIREWWMGLLVVWVLSGWMSSIGKYRKLMKDPFIYLWFLQEEFGDMEPQRAEDCALYRENGGFCKPDEPDVCLRCTGFTKKGKKHARTGRVSD